MGAILNTVTEILGTEPSPQLDEKVYFELIRLRIAMRELAAALDAKIAALSEQEQTAYQTDGLLEHKMLLSALCTVKLPATETLSKNGTLCHLQATGGGALSSAYLVAVKTYQRFADVVCVSDADASGKYDLVLRGMYLNLINTPQNRLYAGDVHYRLSTIQIDGITNNGVTSYTYRGVPTWAGPRAKDQYGYNYVAGYWYIGEVIGAYADDPYFNNYARSAFVYFNPRRA